MDITKSDESDDVPEVTRPGQTEVTIPVDYPPQTPCGVPYASQSHEASEETANVVRGKSKNRNTLIIACMAFGFIIALVATIALATAMGNVIEDEPSNNKTDIKLLA
eukprot:301239_1